MQTTSTEASFFWQLLSRAIGPNNGEALVGDLQEEFAKRASINRMTARMWLVSQYSRALVSGLWCQSGSTLGLSRIMLAATVIVLPLLVGLVAWLSSMDETTPQLWNMVLAGEMHKALFVGEYWQEQTFALRQINDLHMFINYSSLLWALTGMALVMLVGHNKPDAIRAATALGTALMVIPYMLGLLYLDMAQLPPQKIGPIIAFMLFNIFYMLPLMTWWMHRQAVKAEGIQHA